MNYYGAKELAESFRTVRRNTLAAADDIPADKYSFRPSADCRSVEKLLAHIALSYRFQHQIHAVEKRSNLDGFDFPALMAKLGAEEAEPRTKAEVVELLRKEGEVWAKFLEGASEDFLAERVHFASTPPSSKSRLEMMMSVKEHEMHHRGQVMLIQRLLGVVPHLTREREARMAQLREARTPAGAKSGG